MQVRLNLDILIKGRQALQELELSPRPLAPAHVPKFIDFAHIVNKYLLTTH